MSVTYMNEKDQSALQAAKERRKAMGLDFMGEGEDLSFEDLKAKAQELRSKESLPIGTRVGRILNPDGMSSCETLIQGGKVSEALRRISKALDEQEKYIKNELQGIKGKQALDKGDEGIKKGYLDNIKQMRKSIKVFLSTTSDNLEALGNLRDALKQNALALGNTAQRINIKLEGRDLSDIAQVKTYEINAQKTLNKFMSNVKNDTASLEPGLFASFVNAVKGLFTAKPAQAAAVPTASTTNTDKPKAAEPVPQEPAKPGLFTRFVNAVKSLILTKKVKAAGQASLMEDAQATTTKSDKKGIGTEDISVKIGEKQQSTAKEGKPLDMLLDDAHKSSILQQGSVNVGLAESAKDTIDNFAEKAAKVPPKASKLLDLDEEVQALQGESAVDRFVSSRQEPRGRYGGGRGGVGG